MLFQFYLKVTATKSEQELVSLKQNGVLVDSMVNAGWLNNLTLTNRNYADLHGSFRPTERERALGSTMQRFEDTWCPGSRKGPSKLDA